MTVPAQSKALASIRRHLLLGLTIVAAMAIGVGGWAATTEFSGAVIAPGALVVESNTKKVQHPSGGVVGELRVRDGDRVKAGEVLVRLDETVTRANLAVVLKNLDELTVRQARLEAERDGLERLQLPEDVVTRAADPQVARVVLGEQRLFEARRSARAGQVAQLRERVAQLNEQIQGLTEQIAGKKREIELIRQELEGVRELWRKNLVPISRVTALERDAARLTGEHGALVSNIAQTKGKITETELQILQVGEDLRTEVGKELADIRAKVSELAERRVAGEDQLKRIDIRAPQDGMVHQLAVHTVGGVISSGEPLMLIVPDAEALAIEVKIAPHEIDQVRVGHRAILRFSAFNHATTPELKGEVSRVSADLTTDPRSGMSYYTARISVSEAELARLGQRLVPGMPVEAFVQTGERTVLSYLTKPMSDQLMKAWRER